MRAALTILLCLLLAAASRLPEPPVHAEDVLGAEGSGPAQLRDGMAWLEDCGIGIGLTPAPPGDAALPRLIAGDTERGLELYEYAPESPPDWAGRLGLTAGEAAEVPIGADRLAARETSFAADGRVAARVIEWQVESRAFALVQRGEGAAAGDALLRQIVLLPVPAGGRAILLGHGSHACVLRDWVRGHGRFYRVANGTRMGMRAFTLARGQFADLEALQLDLESRLARAGFRRSGGERPQVPDCASFLGEYFGADGYVQRVLYVDLHDAWQVLLFQAPPAARDGLARESLAVAESIRAVDLATSAPVHPWANVTALRAVAWTQGGVVAWGALFDDAAAGAVAWRQPGVSWTAELRGRPGIVARLEGVAASSLELNPLRGPESRAIAIPAGVSGDLELLLRVGNLRASARVHGD